MKFNDTLEKIETKIRKLPYWQILVGALIISTSIGFATGVIVVMTHHIVINI